MLLGFSRRIISPVSLRVSGPGSLKPATRLACSRAHFQLVFGRWPRGNSMADIDRGSHRSPSLTLFFVATFGVTWAFWVPATLIFGDRLDDKSPFSIPLFVVLQTLGAAGPSLVAYWLLRRSGGPDAVRPIGRRYKHWRISFHWYLVAALLVPAIQLAGLLIGGFLRGNQLVEPSSPLGQILADIGLVGLIALFPVIIVAQLPSSPLLEEFGWRGFALPRLQDRYSALTSSAILGLLWGIWHLPLTLAYGDPIVPFLLKITAISVLITWVFNNTCGSMLLAMLCHASLNASIVPFSNEAARWPSVILAITVAAAIIVFAGGRDLANTPRVRWSTQSEESDKGA